MSEPTEPVLVRHEGASLSPSTNRNVLICFENAQGFPKRHAADPEPVGELSFRRQSLRG